MAKSKEDGKVYITYTRPSGTTIDLEDTPNFRSYAKQNGWLSPEEAKVANIPKLGK